MTKHSSKGARDDSLDNEQERSLSKGEVDGH